MIRHAVALLLLLLPACSSPPPGSPHRDLPADLREVSGLAAASPASVFAHDDEQAVIHEIELATGRVLRRFALGNPPARGDFEGIAADRDRVYLIASDGLLLSAPIGADGAHVPFEIHDTGAGAACEIEGLSLAPAASDLLILCKRARGARQAGRLLIYRWSEGTPVGSPWRDIDLGAGELAPSGIEWVAARRQLVVVSARGRMLLLLDDEGRLLGARRLAAAGHPQPEGLAVTAAGELAIADEGGRGRPARLTLYPAGYLRQLASSREESASGLATSSKNPAR